MGSIPLKTKRHVGVWKLDVWFNWDNFKIRINYDSQMAAASLKMCPYAQKINL